jgi:hypothetical protein
MMKAYDILHLSCRGLKHHYTPVYIIFIASGVICLCFSLTVFFGIWYEENSPGEISLSAAPGKVLTDQDMSVLVNLDHVGNCTPVLSLPANITLGKYKANVTVLGVRRDYISSAFEKGGLFPESSSMPILILNEAACKLFLYQEEKAAVTETSVNAPEIDWLSANFSLSIDEKVKPIISRISGIMKDSTEAALPKAYVDFSAAKTVLQKNGQPTAYDGILLQVKKARVIQEVSDNAASLGYMVDPSYLSISEDWRRRQESALPLLFVGLSLLIGMTLFMAALSWIDVSKQSEQIKMLRQIGMQIRHIKNLFSLYMMVSGVAGGVAGIVIYFLILSFFSEGSAVSTVGGLNIKIFASIGALTLCTFFSVFPSLYSANIVKKLFAQGDNVDG